MPIYKTLIIVRHAKAQPIENGQKDIDRVLNDKGLNDASRMGNRLFQMQIKPDAIVCSPANRTKQTAELIAEQINFNTENIVFNPRIYDASARVLLNEIGALADNLNTVLICGHNPGLSYFAEKMSNEEIGELPTCAIVGIQFEIDSWKNVSQEITGKLLFNIQPL